MVYKYVIVPMVINMNTHYYIIRATVGEDTIPIGILKIPPTDDLQHAIRYQINNLRFRRNKRSVMVSYIWEEEISEAEYSTYVEMKILQDISYDYNFTSDCGLQIFSVDRTEKSVKSTVELINSNREYFLTNYKIPV